MLARGSLPITAQNILCTHRRKFPGLSVEVPFRPALWATFTVRVNALCFSPAAAVLKLPKISKVVTIVQGHHTSHLKLLIWRSSSS